MLNIILYETTKLYNNPLLTNQLPIKILKKTRSRKSMNIRARELGLILRISFCFLKCSIQRVCADVMMARATLIYD